MHDLSLYKSAVGCWTNPVALLAASLALAPSKVAHSLFADKPCACWFVWLLVQPLLGSCSRMCFSKFKNCRQRLRSSDSWLSNWRRTVDFRKRKLKALQTRSPNCRTDFFFKFVLKTFCCVCLMLFNFPHFTSLHMRFDCVATGPRWIRYDKMGTLWKTRLLTLDLAELLIQPGFASVELLWCSCTLDLPCWRRDAAVPRTRPTFSWRIWWMFAAELWAGGALAGPSLTASKMAMVSLERRVFSAPTSTRKTRMDWLQNAPQMAANQSCCWVQMMFSSDFKWQLQGVFLIVYLYSGLIFSISRMIWLIYRAEQCRIVEILRTKA